MRLAHLSDIHVSCLSGQALLRLPLGMGKPLLGMLNSTLRRRRTYRSRLLPLVVQDILQQDVDHVVVTGDLSSTSLDAEWKLARQALDPLAQGPGLTVIPGNHDRYVEKDLRLRRFEAVFGDLMPGRGRDSGGPGPVPLVQLGVEAVLVWVDTSLPTGLLSAWGRIGPDRLAGLRSALEELGSCPGRARIVVQHHHLRTPDGSRGSSLRGLKDADELEVVLAELGAELVLHGHRHELYSYEVPGPGGPIPVYDPGPATRVAGSMERSGGYNIFELKGGRVESVRSRCFETGTEGMRDRPI